MASSGDLVLARKLLQALNVHQSQGSLVSQARDAIPLLEAMGYYDLADHLSVAFLAGRRCPDGD